LAASGPERPLHGFIEVAPLAVTGQRGSDDLVQPDFGDESLLAEDEPEIQKKHKVEPVALTVPKTPKFATTNRARKLAALRQSPARKPLQKVKPVSNTKPQPQQPQQPMAWNQLPRMQLERQFAGPLQDTIIQRWRDPADGTICYIYLPITAPHSPPTDRARPTRTRALRSKSRGTTPAA
jgi:hypothetical protein